MTNTDHAFKWLEDHGYPTAAMSQLEGFTTFLLAPIMEEYAAAQGEGYCDIAPTAPHPWSSECVNWTPEIEHNDH